MTAREFFGFVAGTTAGLVVGKVVLGWDWPWLFVLLPLWLPTLIVVARSLVATGYRMIVTYWSVIDAVETIYRAAQGREKKD